MFWLLISKQADDISSSHASSLNPNQLNYFKVLMQAICASSPKGEITLTEARNLVMDTERGFKQLSTKEMEECLSNFIEDGWLHKLQNEESGVSTLETLFSFKILLNFL